MISIKTRCEKSPIEWISVDIWVFYHNFLNILNAYMEGKNTVYKASKPGALVILKCDLTSLVMNDILIYANGQRKHN